MGQATETREQTAEQGLTLADVASRFKVTPRTIMRWAIGEEATESSKAHPPVKGFPRPRQFGRVKRWLSSEVDAFLRDMGR